MSLTKRLLLLGAATALTVGVAAAPALAVTDSASTVVTFTIEEGTLDISAPPTADLGTGVYGTPISGAIGPVTVTDSRGVDDASWVTTVTATDFCIGPCTTAAEDEQVPAESIAYWSGPAINGTPIGNGDFIPGQLTAADADTFPAVTDPLGSLTAFTHEGGSGFNQVTWDPTLIVTLPLGAIAGQYSGTITHTVTGGA